MTHEVSGWAGVGEAFFGREDDDAMFVLHLILKLETLRHIQALIAISNDEHIFLAAERFKDQADALFFE